QDPDDGPGGVIDDDSAGIATHGIRAADDGGGAGGGDKLMVMLVVNPGYGIGAGFGDEGDAMHRGGAAGGVDEGAVAGIGDLADGQIRHATSCLSPCGPSGLCLAGTEWRRRGPAWLGGRGRPWLALLAGLAGWWSSG